MPDSKIRVTSIQRLCVYDGPGVRTTVFLKGCYLQCPWCCNPETIQYDEDFFFDKGCKSFFEETFIDYEVDLLFSLLMRDKSLFAEGGGVTFSGGEPLMQAEVILPLLIKLKEEGVHIAFETTLYAPQFKFQLIREFVDYWMVDVKFQFGYLKNRKYDIDPFSFEENLDCLQHTDSVEIEYRMVVMHEIVERMPAVIAQLHKHHINNLSLLSYHSLGENKYVQLHKPFTPFGTISNDEKRMLIDSFERNGIRCEMYSV